MTERQFYFDSPQGEDESIPYTLDVSKWGLSSPTISSVKAFDTSDDSDVTSTVINGSGSVSGDVITLPLIENLTDGTTYRIEVLFTSGTGTYEAYGFVTGEE